MVANAEDTKQRRRKTGRQVRELMLHAAQGLFAAKGYNDTTTREVARLAHVSEQSVFSHFGSKPGLYEAAVLEPFDAFVRRYTREWRNAVDEIDSLEVMMTRYVDGLYNVVREHRDLLRALPSGHLGRIANNGVFSAVERWVMPLVERHGYCFEPAIAVRSVFVLVTTIALLQDDLIPDRDSSEIVRELTDTLLRGLARKP